MPNKNNSQNLHETHEFKKWELSRSRWKNSDPNFNLTWGIDLDGDDFVSKMNQHALLSKNTKLLEIGPGYGRLLMSILKYSFPFEKYLGIDISKNSLDYLKQRFKNDRINYVLGDCETIKLNEEFNLLFSSATIHHFYPDFENALKNLSYYLQKGGFLVFDLHEGSRASYFENDGITFIGIYTRKKIIEILTKIKLEIVSFEKVIHDEKHQRLLVIARKP